MDLTLVTETFVQDDQRWLASEHGADTAQSVTLDLSDFTAGTHYPNGFIPSGTVLCAGTASGKFGPYDPQNTTTAPGVAVGILLEAVQVKAGSTADPVGAMVKHCFITTAKMPFSGTTKGAWDTAANADLPNVIVR